MHALNAVPADLFDVVTAPDVVKPWKPRALNHDEWKLLDYRGVYQWRIDTLTKLRADKSGELIASAKAYYAQPDKTAEFIMHWMDTYNPRKRGVKWMPFVLFERQAEFVQFLEELDRDNESGLVEKCRDVGATWLLCAFSVKKWLFEGDDATGWGSRKQELVDKLGDPDSIFEKMRLLVRRMPDIWLPDGFKARDHATFMKLINPANGSTITGESGDNIGRGGRKKRYVVDEAAHIERPEKVDAALGDNTEIRIDISSVNGFGNVFHRRREAGIDWQPGATIEPGYTRVFVFDWRQHPEKTQEWYDKRKALHEREGTQHILAQEVDRNYSAAVQNTIIDMQWIQACVDAHLKVPCLMRPPIDRWMASLDVADGGLDRNALALRQWVILRHVNEWGERDPGITTRRMITDIRDRKLKGIDVQTDLIGVGSGVKTEYNRLLDEGLVTRREINIVSWNAGGAVVNPYDRMIEADEDSMLNRDFYGNMKAQAWWSLRTRCYKTWQAVTHGVVYNPEELISLDSEGLGAKLQPLMKEMAQAVRAPNTRLLMYVDKTPEGTRSPNMADAVVMNYFPAPEVVTAMVGGYTG